MRWSLSFVASGGIFEGSNLETFRVRSLLSGILEIGFAHYERGIEANLVMYFTGSFLGEKVETIAQVRRLDMQVG